MRLAYGGYSFPVGQVEVLPSMRTQRDAAGRPYQYDWTIAIRGMMINDANISAAVAAARLSYYDNAFRAAMAVVGGTLVLYDNYDSPTSINFPSSSTALNPVQCVGFEYPDGGAGEYVTKREFSATFTVSYASLGRAGSYIDWHEQIQVIGNGGGLIRWQPSINGPPVPVLIYPETTITVVCSGSATGYDAAPKIPPGPLPGAFLQNPQQAVSLVAPKFMGNGFAQFREFPASWNYVYIGRVIDLRPNLLVPRTWPLGR